MTASAMMLAPAESLPDETQMLVVENETLPVNWRTKEGEPTKQCCPSGGDFGSFKKALRLYKPVSKMASYHICTWMSPYFEVRNTGCDEMRRMMFDDVRFDDHHHILASHSTTISLSCLLLLLLQKHVYCQIDGQWRSADKGALTNHLKNKSHLRVHQAYLAADRQNLKGSLVKRALGEDENTIRFWRWEVEEAALPSSSSSLTSSVTMDSSLTSDGGEGLAHPSANPLPPGYEDHFTKAPLKGHEHMQKHVNNLCGVIARDGRPISFPQGIGFRNYLKSLHPDLKSPHTKTVVETLKAMKIKRQRQIGEELKLTRTRFGL